MNTITLWKKVIIFGAILAFPILLNLACLVDPEDPEDENKFSAVEAFAYSLNATDISGVNLSGVTGEIEVVGLTHSTQIEVWGERRVESNSQKDADEHLDLLEVKISQKNQIVYIETEQPSDSKGRNYDVTYHLRIPQNRLIFIQSVNGTVAIDSLQNDIRVELVNGKVALAAIRASVQVAVVNGEIDATLILPAGGKHDLATTNGAINYKIPSNTSSEFSASVLNGNIHIEKLQLMNSTYASKSVTGKLGSGDGKISLKAVNGNINALGS